MGLSAAAVQLNLDLWRQGFFKAVRSVADIGSQELHLKKPDFEALIASYAVPGYDAGVFAPWNYPDFPRCPAKHLYRLLGVPDYACIDINEEHGALAVDLNKELADKSLYHRFDMITDHGTNEHVFNVSEAYRTMHRLCAPDGLLVVCQQMYRGNGYYLFEAGFFEGLAAANAYAVLFSSFVLTLKDKTEHGSNIQHHVPLSYELLDALDWNRLHSVGITYVFRKTSDADFKTPYQHHAMSGQYGNKGYRLQYRLDPPSRAYVPVTTLETIKGKDLVGELKRRVRRKLKG